MSNHLSDDQFAKYFVGQTTGEELQHVTACAECRSEVERFGHAISLFRHAVRYRVDARGTATLRVVPKWRWAWIAVVAALLLMVPFLGIQREQRPAIPETTRPMDPDALMRAVNVHISRTVPAPMEPMLAVIPNDESITSGGVR